MTGLTLISLCAPLTVPLVPAGRRANNSHKHGSTTVPVFATPEPIIVNVEVGGGDVRLIAGDRTDTSVEVRPGNRTRSADVRAAEMTRVEYANGRLRVKGPKAR